MLEQTRGVLVADTVDARSSDLTRLREAAPDLARAFEELRARREVLDQSDPGTLAASAAAVHGSHAGGANADSARHAARDLAQARRRAQTEWTELIDRIRAVEGFAGFLAVPGIDELAAQTHDGPVVFVVVSSIRCDALILTSAPIARVHVVPLGQLTEASAYDQVNRLITACGIATDASADLASRVAAQAEILAILAWIWDTITEPILAALGHTAVPDSEDSWPRLWWCPVGVLAYLPLHAAGHHTDLSADDPALAGNPRTALDRVISSYTTTVRGLAYARISSPDNPATVPVIVAVPDAPGAAPLPGATAEIAALAELMPGSLVLTDPTRDDVLAALPDHQVAHLACHGHADWTDPASSRLILRDDDVSPLTVADVSALQLTGGLAYLSACDTTVTSPDLADEAVHITGAFHLAGYPHVIGTLWPVDDGTARDLVEDFYTHLTVGGSTAPQIGRSAEVLHHATRRLRARYPKTPTYWAAHTHTGT